MEELEEAIRFLESEYEMARKLEEIRSPISYALYKTWKRFDRRNKAKENQK